MTSVIRTQKAASALDRAFTTLSGEPIAPLYTAADLPELDQIGVPGQYPYTTCRA
jgi:hypothetical protein